jgi:hypothetical protein
VLYLLIFQINKGREGAGMKTTEDDRIMSELQVPWFVIDIMGGELSLEIDPFFGYMSVEQAQDLIDALKLE